jgi:hypothetical protein
MAGDGDVPPIKTANTAAKMAITNRQSPWEIGEDGQDGQPLYYSPGGPPSIRQCAGGRTDGIKADILLPSSSAVDFTTWQAWSNWCARTNSFLKMAVFRQKEGGQFAGSPCVPCVGFATHSAKTPRMRCASNQFVASGPPATHSYNRQKNLPENPL